jgi:YggT family protein
MLHLIIEIYSLVLLASVLLSWLPIDPDNPFVRFIRSSTEPVLEPIRRILPPVAGLDLSPMVLLLALQLLQRWLP